MSTRSNCLVAFISAVKPAMHVSMGANESCDMACSFGVERAAYTQANHVS